MGYSRQHDKDNPLAYTSPQRKDGFDMNIGLNSDEGTLTSSPNIFQSVSPAENMQSIGQSCTEQIFLENGTRMIAGFVMPNRLQCIGTDTNAKNSRSTLPRNYSVSEVPLLDLDTRGVPNCTNQGLILTSNSAMNDTGFNSIQNPPTNINFMLKRDTAGGYQMVRRGGEARGSNIYLGDSTSMLSHTQNGQTLIGSNVNVSENRYGFFDGNIGSLGGSTSLFPQTPNGRNGQIGNSPKVGELQCKFEKDVNVKVGSSMFRTSSLSDIQNTGQTEIGCNVKGSGVQGVLQEKIDGSFLSLGIGGNEIRSKSKFSCQEIANKLDLASAPELTIPHAQQTTSASTCLGQNLDAGIPSFQANADRFFYPTSNMGGCSLPNNEVGLIRGASSSPLQIMRRAQDAMKHNLSMAASRNSSFVSNRTDYPDLDPCSAIRNNQASLSGEIGSNSDMLHSSRPVHLPGLASVSAKPAFARTQPASDVLHNFSAIKPQDIPSEYFAQSPFSFSSTRSNHPGLSLTGRAAERSGLPQIRAQPAGQLLSHNSISAQAAVVGLLPQRMGIPAADTSAPQAATSGLFPKRLGVEYNGNGGPQAAERDLPSKGIAHQTAGKIYQTSNMISTQLSNNRLARTPIGQPDAAMPVPMLNIPGPSFATGRSQDVPVHFSKGPTESSSTNGPSIPVVSVHSQPSLKRRAMWSPPGSHWVQRQKITKPIVRPYVHQIKTVAPIPVTSSTVAHPYVHPMKTIPPIPVTPAYSHIKRQVSEALPPPTGEKCHICKRDLSFIAEGPVYQPAVPPAVAVLPCGHTFHDQCLQNITPKDQSKEPPCIPCAINEN